MSLSRRTLLIGGGAGIGLVVAWGAWPRRYPPALTAAPGEALLGAYLKIGEDGHVTIAVPQSEGGQGVYTALPQILADELGADWRTVGVEAAPASPLYANPLALDVLTGGAFDGVAPAIRREWATRHAVMLTGGSTSVRQFEAPLRRAGAVARTLLCKAAAARWDADWRDLDTQEGFVRFDEQRLRFGELAAAAAAEMPEDEVELRFGDAGRLSGQSLPRLDVPAKVDGSANYAGDVRLPDMVFASVREGPIGDSRLVRVDRAAADRVPGVVAVIENPRWVAAAATTWWAANRALDALAPRFETRGPRVDSASIAAALDAAFDGDGRRVAAAGDLADVFRGAQLVTATYRAAAGVHAAIETRSATARFSGGRLELWCATDAPVAARDAAAAAIGIDPAQVTVHPMLVGGSFGAALETDIAAQAAILTAALKRPVQLTRSRSEETLHDRYRPPAAARMAARLGAGGAILGWSMKVAAPDTGAELARRLVPGAGAALRLGGGSGAGMAPPYRLPAFAVDHHVADIGVPTGYLRGGADTFATLATECFVDELAHVAGTEAMSYRIGMLGGQPRLARCLSTAAALGGWDGGVAGSGQGIACYAGRGSFVAVLAEAHMGETGRPVVDRLVAAVDCGRAINPDLVRQQIEGGLLFGLAGAIGADTGFEGNLAVARGFGHHWLPRLADTPDISVELIASDAEPGGASEIAVPPVAPAIANALRAATGLRMRSLPLRSGA